MVVGLRTPVRRIQARRLMSASGCQSRKVQQSDRRSSARSHLEQRQIITHLAPKLNRWEDILACSGKNILLCNVFAAFPGRKGLWLPSIAGLNCPLWGTRLWYVCEESWYPVCGCSTVRPSARHKHSSSRREISYNSMRKAGQRRSPCGYEAHQLNS